MSALSLLQTVSLHFRAGSILQENALLARPCSSLKLPSIGKYCLLCTDKLNNVELFTEQSLATVVTPLLLLPPSSNLNILGLSQYGHVFEGLIRCVSFLRYKYTLILF